MTSGRETPPPPQWGSAPGPGGGGSPLRLLTKAFAPWTPLPPFGNVNFVTIKMWYYPACARVRSTIKHNLTSALRQTNSRFLFPISDKVSYVPRQSNCLLKYVNIRIKVVIARNRFSSHIVETLSIYYSMLVEYMFQLSKLLTVQNSRNLSLKKKFKKRLNTEFPMLRENWTTFSITVNKYFFLLQSNFSVRLKAVWHFISQILEEIDHPVPEIKNYHDRHMCFRINTPEYYTLWYRTRWRIGMCVFTIIIQGVFTNSNTND